jgi:porphobilinogen deaminase
VTTKLVVGTRGSKLAIWQASYVAARLREHYPGCDILIRHILTSGDKILDVPLARIDGKGLFTKELEKELLDGSIDLAVHSLKDMPTELPPGLAIGAVTERVDPGDALISPKYKTLANLPTGAVVGTSSLRRKAQLLASRPDIIVTDLRGNIDTRLAKLANGELDAIVLAVAGLRRLGWEERITQILPREVCLPAVGQGALAIEIRAGDEAVLAKLAFLHHFATATAVLAERAFLREVGGGCQVPIGVYGRLEKGELVLEAAILSGDGRIKLVDSISGPPEAADGLGHALARRMYAAGGRKILAGLGCFDPDKEDGDGEN